MADTASHLLPHSILITGGTGFLGRALCAALVEAGCEVTVLSRGGASFVARHCGSSVRGIASLKDAAQHYDAVINLAGAPIAARWWTPKRQAVLRASRVTLTEGLAAWIQTLPTPPRVVLQGSAIGYYGVHPDATFTENDAPRVPEFTHALCRDWEAAAAPLASPTTRLCILRTGVVLHPSGGVLQRMLLPFRLGLGAVMGRGTQWMAWIAREDWVGLALFALQNPHCTGVFNATAPHPVTHRMFARTLGRWLHRPVFFSAPAWLLRAALGRNMADALLLESPKALPTRALEAGYPFQAPTLEQALQRMV